MKGMWIPYPCSL